MLKALYNVWMIIRIFKTSRYSLYYIILSLPIDTTIGFNPMARNWNSSKPLRLIGEKTNCKSLGWGKVS